MDRINYNQMYYFWVIAKCGSMKKACQILHLTQPGLSTQLRQFEEFIGKKVFDRKSRKLTLNNEGRTLFEYATRIFNQTEEMLSALRSENTKRVSLVQVGVLPSISKTHIHEFILPLLKQKNVTIRVIEGPLEDLIGHLQRKTIDFFFSDRPTFLGKRKVFSYRLQRRKIIVVGSPKFKSLIKGFPRSLGETPFMQMTQHSQLRSEIDFFLSKNNLNPRVVLEADNITLLRIAAEKGMAVTVLPQNMVEESLKSKKLIKIGELVGVESDIWAMVHPDSASLDLIKKSVKSFIQVRHER